MAHLCHTALKESLVKCDLRFKFKQLEQSGGLEKINMHQ